MAKLILSEVSNAETLSVINENFRKVAEEFQEKVLYRKNPKGEPNSMSGPLDLNGNPLYNNGVITELPVEEAYKSAITPVTLWGPTITPEVVWDAVADMKLTGGGILYFPNKTGTNIGSPDLGDSVTLEINGPDAPGSLFGEPMGTTLFAQKIFRSQNTRLSTDRIQSTVHVEHKAKGSGQSGQGTADVGLSVLVLKEGVGSGTERSGELNGVDISIRNGGADCDSAGILMNVGAYGTGFHALIEGVVTNVQNNVIVQALNVQLCVIDNRSGKSYGLVIQSHTGGQDVGVLIQNTTGGAFNDFSIFKYNNLEAHRINGLGITYMRDPVAGHDNRMISMGVVSGSLNFGNDSGSASLMSLTQSGRLQVQNEISVGPIILRNEITGQATSGSVNKPTLYAGFIGMEYNGAFYRIPYYKA